MYHPSLIYIYIYHQSNRNLGIKRSDLHVSGTCPYKVEKRWELKKKNGGNLRVVRLLLFIILHKQPPRMPALRCICFCDFTTHPPLTIPFCWPFFFPSFLCPVNITPRGTTTSFDQDSWSQWELVVKLFELIKNIIDRLSKFIHWCIETLY